VKVAMPQSSMPLLFNIRRCCFFAAVLAASCLIATLLADIFESTRSFFIAVPIPIDQGLLLVAHRALSGLDSVVIHECAGSLMSPQSHIPANQDTAHLWVRQPKEVSNPWHGPPLLDVVKLDSLFNILDFWMFR
jgi:hypothetical protein